MSCKFTEIQCREVICIESGRRLGFVSDVVVELPEGRVCAIVVPGPARLLGLAFRALQPREQEILSMRFYDGQTQMEVAARLGISQAQVSRLEKGAIQTMRKYISVS